VDGVHKSRSNRRYVRNLSSRRYAVFFPAFTRAHLALCAAAIFLRAAADSVRLPRIGTTFAVARTLAHRALWAAAILARPAADIFLLPAPFPDAEPRAASAAPIRRSSLARRSRSCSNNWTTPDKLDIEFPLANDCNKVIIEASTWQSQPRMDTWLSVELLQSKEAHE